MGPSDGGSDHNPSSRIRSSCRAHRPSPADTIPAGRRPRPARSRRPRIRRGWLDGRFARIDARFGDLETKVDDVKSDLMKWSFVFWCRAVAAVAALAGV